MEFVIVPVPNVFVAVSVVVDSSAVPLIVVKFALIFRTINVLLDPNVLPHFIELIVKNLLLKCLEYILLLLVSPRLVV